MPKRKLRIVVASPGDVQQERKAAERIIKDIARQEASVHHIETFLWESNVAPGLSRLPVQIGLIDPEARIPDSDIVVVLFSARLGTPIAPRRPTGTEHEFQTALESWRLTGRPEVMVYFNSAPVALKTLEEVEQYAALMRFRLSLPRTACMVVMTVPRLRAPFPAAFAGGVKAGTTQSQGAF